MPRAVPEQSVFVDLLFPQRGLDLSRGYANQLPGTAPAAINVRLQEPGQLRDRGGSRPGLVKYVAGQIPEGAQLIQHLTFIVDPTVDALLDDLDYDDPNGILDPSSAGPSSSWGLRFPSRMTRAPVRRIRRGGTGRRLTKNRRPTLSITATDQEKTLGATLTPAGTEFTATGLLSGDGILIVSLASSGFAAEAEAGFYSITPSNASPALGTDLNDYKIIYVNGTLLVEAGSFIQAAQAQYASHSTSKTIAFADNVQIGHLLLFAVALNADSSLNQPEVTVSDSLGHTWSQVGIYFAPAGSIPGYELALFYTIANSSGPCTVTYSPTVSVTSSAAVAEYSGVDTDDPLDTFSQSSSEDPDAATWTTGVITPSGSNQLVVAVHWYTDGFLLYLPDSPTVQRVAPEVEGTLGTYVTVGVSERVFVTGSIEITGTITEDGDPNPQPYLAIAAAFNPG